MGLFFCSHSVSNYSLLINCYTYIWGVSAVVANQKVWRYWLDNLQEKLSKFIMKMVWVLLCKWIN